MNLIEHIDAIKEMNALNIQVHQELKEHCQVLCKAAKERFKDIVYITFNEYQISGDLSREGGYASFYFYPNGKIVYLVIVNKYQMIDAETFVASIEQRYFNARIGKMGWDVE